MSRQKCSYKNEIKARKEPKSKEKHRTKVCNLTKTSKS